MEDWDPTWGFWIGKCVGTACGGWGDPHIITCDGLFYDCQGMGIFTLMENHVFNIQATFIDVGAEERAETASWLTQGASIANDFMIQYLPDETAPILQFSFGDIEDHDGSWPAEDGCDIKSYYHEYFDYSIEPSVQDCRARCEETDYCDKFSYWYDGFCFFHEWWATRMETYDGWTRTVSGDLDGTCGILTPDDLELMDEEQNAKATRIGRGCPLLLFADGDMLDISDTFYEGDLYGEEGDDIHVELIWGHWIHVTYKLEGGDYAVIQLSQGGNGLGQMWSCHFDFWVCLPESEKEAFESTTVGLLGSPDYNTQNDWMTPDGEVLELNNVGDTQEEYDENMIDYCYENWCVEQGDSLMTYHGNHTYDNYKCEEEEYFDINECALNIDKIEEHCADVPLLMIHSCEVDCCFGGCGDIDEVIEEIEDLIKLDDGGGDTLIGVPNFDDCVGDEFIDTSDSVCPFSPDPVVTLLGTSGDEPLPDGEIFYGINVHSEPTMDVGHQTVRFKVNNPFPDTADVYVKYEKAVLDDMSDPHCAKMLDTPSGCDKSAVDIEVFCRDFTGSDPFALVEVYFVSEGVAFPDNDFVAVDQCCEPESYGSDVGTVRYTFEVLCVCPPDTSIA